MSKLIILNCLFLLSNIKSVAQQVAAIYSKPGLDRGVHIHKAKNEEFIVTGITTPVGDEADGLVLRYSSTLALQSSRSYGGKGYDFLWGIAETKDSGLMVVGFTNSFGNGDFDAWILKLKRNGDTVWTKTLGGSGEERAITIIPTRDGHFAVVGQTSSWGKGDNDVLLFKISENGEILWTQTMGDIKSDRGFYLQEVANGDLLISGITENNIHNDIDALLIRTTAEGETKWIKSFGASGADVAHSLLLDNDEIIIGGYKEYEKGMHRPWIFHLNQQGTLTAETIIQTDGDARIIGGYINAQHEFIGTGYIRASATSDWNLLLVRPGTNGHYTSTQFGQSGHDQGYGICEFGKGTVLITGHSYNTGDKDGDLVLLKWQYK